jgi:D-alanyl-D-alanine dipeptidase
LTTLSIATSVIGTFARIEFPSQRQWSNGDSGLIVLVIRCFIFSFILPADVVVLNSVVTQPAIPLVDIKSVDPTIVIELRYAGANNLLGRALYPPGTRAVVRPEVASRLVAAQAFLRRYHYQLKIWDAYRPKPVQVQLWQVAHNNNYVADPQAGPGSLHSWGLAVDATLIDTWNRPVTMPTDFDDFTSAAMWHYRGADPAIRSHVHLLQIAMRDAGFYGLPTEWWHFTIAEWQIFLPPEDAKRAMQALGTHWQGKLPEPPIRVRGKRLASDPNAQ